MIFNLIIFIIFAAVAYFHYTQGLFSAALSAMICVLSAVLAIGYNDVLASYILSKAPEQATAISITAIFIVSYVAMRLIFDNLVPGNVRYPLLVDKIGAGAAGVVAGLFCTGVLGVAAQSLPFGAAIAGFSRQDLGIDRPVSISGGEANESHSIDAVVSDEVLGNRLGDSSHGLWFNQDGMVVELASQLSDAGSVLDNDRPFEQAHPDYLDELFGQRLGIPPGAKHVATGGISIANTYVISTRPPRDFLDAEIKDVRQDEPLPEQTLPDGPTTLAVVRVNFGGDSGDSDGFLRLSPAAVRLCTSGRDFYPIGTLVGGTLLLANRFDDPLIVDLKSGQAVDFVFPILTDDLNESTEGKVKRLHFKNDAFLEVKRFALADLGGRELEPTPPDSTVDLKTYQSSGVLDGIVRKPTSQLQSRMRIPEQLQQRQGGGNPAPGEKSHRHDNDFLDPTRIPINEMGL